MSSTPNSSIGSEIKTPPYMSDPTSASLQPPYGSRSSTLSSLPPPQSVSLSGNSQMYTHQMSFPGQHAGNNALHTASKNMYQRLQTGDAMNYPSLNSTSGVGNVNGNVNVNGNAQSFQQLSQAALQNLPQNNYSISHPAYSQAQDKAAQAYVSQASFQAFPSPSPSSSQVQHSQNQYSTQGLDMQNTGQPHAVVGSDQYSMPQNGHIKHDSQSSYAHIPKFVPARRPRGGKTPLTNKFSILPAPVPNTSKPFVCTYEGCIWAFARQSDLRRHTKSHITPAFHCPYWKNDPTCHRNGGSFSRLDVLKRHLRLIHFIKDKQRENENEDPGWCRACQKLFPTSKSFIEHCEDCSRQGVSAEWKSNVAAESVSAMNQ